MCWVTQQLKYPAEILTARGFAAISN